MFSGFVHQWGGNALVYGLISASYSIFQLIGSPILGRWSDSYGRKKILVISQIGTVLTWILVIIDLIKNQLKFEFSSLDVLNVYPDLALLTNENQQ